jgi:hypothetical protein
MNDLAGAISSMLKETLFKSCKALCGHFRIGNATLLRIPHDELGLKKCDFPRVRQARSINQKSEKVSCSKFLLISTDGTEGERLSPDYH